MNEAIIEAQKTVEFGGLIWEINPEAYNGGVECRTYQAGVGEFRCYQYPLEAGCFSAGQWLWEARLNGLLHPMPRPSHLDMEISHIVPTRDEAMQCCLEAKGKFIEQVVMLAELFGVKNRGDYEAGFFEGKKAGKEEVIKAVKESLL